MTEYSQPTKYQYPPILCTNCGVPSPTSQQSGKFIDDGISIDINSLGHYGGFTDNFPYKESDYLAHLCHDCCVVLFNALPGFAKFADVRGGHGNITGRWCYADGEMHEVKNGTLIKPCCQYAWTWDATDPKNIVSYIATKDLDWVTHPEADEVGEL